MNLARKDVSADALNAVFPDQICGIKKLLGIYVGYQPASAS
jgi:hypothetical protein